MKSHFYVLWGKEGNKFKAAEKLTGKDGKPLFIPAAEGKSGHMRSICTRPTAVDWDSDGDLDLVVGNVRGDFFVFYSDGVGKFQSNPERLMLKDGPLRVVGGHGDPFVIDWDGDGDLDLLSGGGKGGVFWSENVSDSASSPKMSPFKTLIEVPDSKNYTFDEPAFASRIWVDDVDGDKKLDLLTGDRYGLVWFYKQK